MTFKEKSAAVTLVALIFVYGAYFANAMRLSPDVPVETIDGALIRTVVTLVAILIVFHIVVAAFHGRKAEEEEDERDRQYELIGDRNGGYVVGFGAVSAMIMLLGQLPPSQVIHVLLGAVVLSEIAKIVTQLVLYRRGL